MRRWHVAAAFVAGGASVLAYAPVEWWPLTALTLAGLFWLLQRTETTRAGFVTGFAYGLGAFLAGVSWLFVALNRYGNMPAPLAALAVLLFCSVLAVFHGVAGALFVRLRSGRTLPDTAAFAASWLLGEWLRGWVLTGFPWLASGYSQTPPSPLAGFLPVLGVYGVGGVLALCSALGVVAFAQRAWRPALALLAICAAGLGLARIAWTEPVGAPVKVALLQTNIEQHLKWQPEMLGKWLRLNLRMVQENPATLVVLPETTLPLLVDQLPDGYVDRIAEVARAAGGDVILGTFTRDGDGHIYNAAVSLGSGPGQHYAKQHLVPFGEYSPPLFRWFYDLVDIPMSDQTRGAAVQAPMRLAGQAIAVNICYEDVFGEELIRALPQATLMLNLSNLAWYGNSFAQPQHLQMSRVRAMETGRQMLRSTNTGMTAVLRPDGSVQAVLPAFATGALHAEVRGYQGMTPYARWGNWLAVGLGLAVLIHFGIRRRR